ncbi:hypothetical protein [Bacillus mycoides]|uniref:hypothetical protein n=1 Tax=Bacillus mycoides TaxID=1405 RepID=UPI002736D6AF|nr:hypothetical protein [Bacillus mycoides]
MKQLHIRLSLIQLFLLVLNIFIFSSALPFLPWFVENAFGWIGILAVLVQKLFYETRYRDKILVAVYLIIKSKFLC